MINNVTVIIRSVGERTEQLCYKLIAEQVDPKQIHIVRKVPFTESMKKSFRIGLRENRKWTLCIDADILIQPNAIKDLIEFGEEARGNVCEIQGTVVDKFFYNIRTAGNHLYRTSLLEEVIKRTPENSEQIRPEYYTLNQMRADGYPWVRKNYIVGLHDFEQFYRDIFRKFYVHAHKHGSFVSSLTKQWRYAAKSDFDYQAALWGIAAGLVSTEIVQISVDKTPYHIFEYFKGNKVLEKDTLRQDCWNGDCVDSLVEYYRSKYNYDEPRLSYMIRGIRLAYNKVGLIRFFPFVLGKIMSEFGQALIRKVT